MYICTKVEGGEGSSQMHTIAYNGGGMEFKVGHAHTKKFWTTKSQNFPFFVQKKLLHCHLLLCIEKCKLD